jgi:membrane protease YdiL (CAAX protease family)
MSETASLPAMQRFAPILFWLALVFAVTMALLPHPPHLPIDGFGDKFEHMLAFATLTVLGSFAFPEMPRWRLAERLSFLGALIEVMQSIPALHRDCDIRDWIADTLAILIVTGLVALGRSYAAQR